MNTLKVLYQNKQYNINNTNKQKDIILYCKYEISILMLSDPQ